ncbi:LysM peptidoglycan-binding domain-containing protein [Burkholderia cepacia]|uniref:LysM peptidoglycan-binding domain-containing protein n=1 Tax=Burkholderia cepacia TaxID=292 RepID=UPI001C935A97|nr:LysM domain-containing protein [Burkholderia cepacia]MBY4709575.1 LysM peptidoglycan-binding domain-containing protein [Burkholderia cepacia]MBY4736501.1 LysM peptidoglycan-binding domain-containing protein [Burkholderia cepacia]MBY4744962.1 LysM peptidoglycan-binding domain-containing protein [Burkholderia cepacia]MBY4756094.1 LysM peptidoglycan-binding domain-containing protein [Burkholderia cepacia]MBY4776453.1 LysM peptidoglycan-binding domain-containing protein [Burkholderia cepacia]
MSLQSLQTAFANASWPVTLNAAFLSSAGVTPPAGFDALLKSAFCLGDATGLPVGQGTVGAVTGDTFSVTGATLTNGLFGATAANTSVALVFTLPADTSILLVQIVTSLRGGWTFASSAFQMVGKPFSTLAITQPCMLFSSAAGSVNWPTPSSNAIALAAGMNFAGTAQLNDYAQSILGFTSPALTLPSPLVISGPFDASAVAASGAYPVMDLKAWLPPTSFSLLGFSAVAPRFEFSIGPVPADADPDDDVDAAQDIAYVFAATVTTASTPPLVVDCSVVIFADNAAGGGNYSLFITPSKALPNALTPANIAAIAGLGTPFIDAVPAPIQRFFTSIALYGVNVTAVWSSGAAMPSITSTGVSVGTVDDFSLVLIDDPTGKFSVTLTSLELDWYVLNPATQSRQQSLLFTSTFTLMPTVFKDDDDKDGGQFVVTIDQNYAITAAFNGQVSLADLLPAITGGLVGMPSGIDVTFSDVLLSIDTGAGAYSFSFAVNLEVDVITYNGNPLLRVQDMVLAISAQTPRKAGAKTTYSASMKGGLIVGPVGLNVAIEYDGAAEHPQWLLSSSLASPLNLGELLVDLFDVLDSDLGSFLPDFLPSHLVVDTFAVDAVIPTGSGASSYSISGSLDWRTDALPGLPIACKASLALAYDGSQATNRFSGSVLGTISLASIPSLTIGYAFNQPGSQGGTTLTVQWAGVTGAYDSTHQTIRLSFNGWSLGTLVTELVALTGDAYFTLSGPWTFLNAISLDGLSVTFYLAADAKNQITASYTLPSPITTGFLNIEGFDFNRDPKTNRILFSIRGSSPLASSSDQWKNLFASPDNDGSKPAQGQDVTRMPGVPGQGNELFDLQLLALGQRVSINDANLDTTKQVIDSLKLIPSTLAGGGNPVNPGSGAANQPYYNAQSNWLIAAHMLLLGVKNPGGKGYTYTIDVMVVFNDPNLYGLRLAFAGSKAGPLADLSFDIMYKKVTDSIGVYQIEFTLPTALRQWNFGAVNITLPSIGVEVYTNGDFLFDVGFPYNMDFSQSFVIQMVVPPGIPVMGGGGFYYGQLSNATATNLPKTIYGTFDPVIEFGLGLQAGIGYSIDKGILSAGFSITFFGIIQGVIAPYHPYQLPNKSDSDTSVQATNYFWLEGQFGICGKLYGTVNFAIISASVSLTITIAAQVVYEAYHDIPLSVSASVSVSVSVRINLGLFSFSISFSFATTISEDFTIRNPSGAPAPWLTPPGTARALEAPRGRALPASDRYRAKVGRMRRMEARRGFVPLTFAAHPSFAAHARANAAGVADAAPATLTILMAPQFTVLAPDVANLTLAGQQGAFVTLFSMDAPSADGKGNASGSSFASLCSALLPWVITSHPGVAADAFDTTPVTIEDLKVTLNSLACPTTQPAIPMASIVDFLKATFTVDVVTDPALLDTSLQDRFTAGAVIFPALPGLELTVPSPTAEGKTVSIALGDWAQVTPDYRSAVIAAFNKLAATLVNPANPPASPPPSDCPPATPSSTPESLTQVVFEDSFALIARQLLQAAIDAYASYPYVLRQNDSIQSIVDFAHIDGKHNPDFTPADLVNANSALALAAGNVLQLAGLGYTVQSGDTLNAIAARYSAPSNSTAAYATAPDALIVLDANARATALLQPGVTITVGAASTTTEPGSSFASVADALGIPLATLAADKNLWAMNTLLLPGATLAIPSIAYTTAKSPLDTLELIFNAFGLTTEAFVGVAQNLTVTGLFAFDASRATLVHLSNLDDLTGEQLAQAVAAGETIGNTAGMVSRFMLQGLRLPSTSGLTLPSGFLYPAQQPDYGLYQLTGQQFPVTSFTEVPVSLAKDKTLDWLQINGSAGNDSGKMDLTPAAAHLQTVLDWAIAHGYNPSGQDVDPPLTVAAESPLRLVPQQFAASAYLPWATSGTAEMLRIASAPGFTPSPTAQVKPIVWALPSSLLSAVEIQQGALTADADLSAALPYLPVLAPMTLTTDPTTHIAIPAPVDDFTLATRIDFKIRQLQQSAGAQTQTARTNTLLPAGPGNTPPVTQLAPNAYELLGPNPGDAQLLERILLLLKAAGPSAVSGLIVGYGDPSGAQAGLVGHLTSDVYTFVTRTNLSTQGNPPPQVRRATAGLASADDAQPSLVNNFANDFSEFIQLLWELSTVQSGGYSFYWNGLAKGTALPSGIFDASGYATLTILVTYARDASLPSSARMTDCCNAVVTTGNIDPARSTFVMVSQSNPQTAGMRSTDTLASFATRHSMTPGTVARDNLLAPLTQGSTFALSAAVHEVTPADVASGDVWGTVARYYSHHATPATVITAAALQGYNPRVTAPTLYTLLFIPTIDYVVQQGDTFSGIADYFGLDAEQVGSMAQHAAGLIAGTQPLNVDSQSFSVSQSIGVGNIGLQLARANLPTPTDPASADYGQQYLFSLYSLLDAGYYANPFFSNSVAGLPFGPTNNSSAPQTRRQLSARHADRTLQASLRHASRVAAIRDPDARRAMLQAEAASGILGYEQALTFGANALANAAPANPPAHLPPASANPYLGVGTFAQLNLRWLDVFGNQTATPFNDPPTDYAGPLNNAPIPILYTDRLIALSQWPNVSASYRYAGAAGAPQLQITLQLNTAAYQPSAGQPAQAAVTDATLFNNVYFQLNQDYSRLGIPGLTGAAVTLAIRNSLTGAAAQPLDTTASAQLIDFVNRCAQTVNAAAASQPVAPPANLSVTLTLDVDLASVVDQNVTRLQLWLVQRRRTDLVDPSLLDTTGGASIETEISPHLDYVLSVPAPAGEADDAASDASVDALLTFARDFETAFVTHDWQLRAGTGPADPDEALSNQTYTVWSVRFNLNDSSKGIAFTLGTAASFFAPKPLANSLYSGSVVLPVYTTGKPLEFGSGPITRFTNVDLNGWFGQALGLVDNFLSPAYVVQTFMLDKLQGNDPASAGYLFDILQDKSALATTIAGTIRSILAQPDASPATLAAARETLKQSLLQQLGNAYAVTATVVLPVTNATTHEPPRPGTASPPSLYGLPVNPAPSAPNAKAPNYTFSQALLPLNASKGGKAEEDGTAESALAFLFTCSNPTLQTNVSIPLTYQITHLQNDITAVAGIDGYRQSSWIGFVTGPIPYPINAGNNLEIPVALLALPTPPTAQAQTADASKLPTAPAPHDLAHWDYAFTYVPSGVAQDSLLGTVAFNTRAAQSNSANAPSNALFVALAGLLSCAPAIFADFNTYLPQITPDIGTTSPAFLNAAAALAAWKTLIGSLNAAYSDWANRTLSARAVPYAAPSGPPPVTLSFSVELEKDKSDGSARVIVDHVSGDASLVPLIEFLSTSYTPLPADPPPAFPATYRYYDSATKEYLGYDAAFGLPMTVAFPALDAIRYQTGDTSIEFRRNLDLVPGKTVSDDFVFSTPPVAFATPAVPLVPAPGTRYDLASLTPPVAPPAPLSAYLDAFFTQLLATDDATWVIAQVSASARYPISAAVDGPRITLPVALMPSGEPSASNVAALANAVSAWLTDHRSALKGIGATINLAVTLHGTAPGVSLPIVRMDDVYVDIDDLA